MVVWDGGLAGWSSDPLVTLEYADAYASARGWSDWTTQPEQRRLAAILDASTYVRSSFLPPAPLTGAREATIHSALTEAARLSLTGPLVGGDAAGKPSRKSVQAGSARVEYDTASASALRSSRLALVLALLRSAGVTGSSSINRALRKA